MQWTLEFITAEDTNGPLTFTAETPTKCVRLLMIHAINQFTDDCIDLLHQHLTELCEFMIDDIIEADPQDYYRCHGGDMGSIWTINLKPAPPRPDEYTTEINGRHIRVHFADPAHNFDTQINGSIRQICDYYRQPLNVPTFNNPDTLMIPTAITFFEEGGSHYIPLLESESKRPVSAGF